MKATGIIRRIDELGRIVIPKEIRKALRIKDGENLEIYVDGAENIILRKYSAIRKMSDFAQDLTDAIYSLIKHNVIIVDNHSVIAVSGPLKKEYMHKDISTEMETKVFRREEMLERHSKRVNIVNDKVLECTYVISPIVINGDAAGAILILDSNDQISDIDFKIAKIGSNFLNVHLE